MKNRDDSEAPNQDLLEKIKAGDEAPLRELYRDHRDEFINWAAQQFNAEAQDAAEIFQRAIIIFFNNVSNGKLSRLDASPKTYLFAVGKNLLKKNYQQKNRIELSGDLYSHSTDHLDFTLFQEMDLNHLQKTLQKLLNQLSETCRKIINLYYYLDYSLDAIRESLNYSSVETAKSMKYKCMQQLRELGGEKLSQLL